MIAESVGRIGIMFDATSKRSFPTLDDFLGGSFEGRPPELAHFLVVATDPARVLYFNDDTEAIDVTNYAVLRDMVPGAPVVRGDLWAADGAVGEIARALGHGAATYRGLDETVIIVGRAWPTTPSSTTRPTASVSTTPGASSRPTACASTPSGSSVNWALTKTRLRCSTTRGTPWHRSLRRSWTSTTGSPASTHRPSPS
jgi:hypothetical protein